MIHSSPSLTALVREAREVGARAGLGEQLAPRVLAVEDAQQVFLLLPLVAVRDDRRRGEQVAETGGRTDRAVLGDRLAHDAGEVARLALAPASSGNVGAA